MDGCGGCFGKKGCEEMVQRSNYGAVGGASYRIQFLLGTLRIKAFLAE